MTDQIGFITLVIGSKEEIRDGAYLYLEQISVMVIKARNCFGS